MNTKMLHDQRHKYNNNPSEGDMHGDEFEKKNCSGALLDMLAEVASQTLHSDPSVKSPVKRPPMRGSEMSHLSNKKKQRVTGRGRNGEGDVMDLDQLRSLTANHLLKLFSEFDGDEIRRTFTYTCFIEPEQCHQQFSSFGSEGKARQQMKSHLLEHVHQLELKAEHGCQFAIESIKIRRRRLAEALHISRRLKNGTKIKVEPGLKSEPTDENDSSLPNKENNIVSLSENCVIMKSSHKSERVTNHETVENLNEMGNGDDTGSHYSNVVVERMCGTEEKNKITGIYDEHNYVTFDMWGNINVNTPTEKDNQKIKSENKIRSVGLDVQKHRKADNAEEESGLEKSPTADLGKFMIAETLRDMVMVCVVENDQLQLKQLPCVGQEIDINTSHLQSYKMIRSDELPVVQDNRKAEPQDYVNEVMSEMNCEKNIERDEYIQKKKPKGKAKFIGQSKAEKEMAIQLIETMKRKGNSDSLECNICNPPRSFTAPTTLISHYRSHAGIKPYECRICNSVFTRQHSLNYHMLIHSNQTRFTCADCGRKFRHPSHFKEHRRRHTGESPYECSDCMLRFKTRNTYKRHLKTRHGKVLTTSGGLIILSEEEFKQVRTLPRTPHSNSVIQVKQEPQNGKRKARKGKGRMKVGGKRRRLEPYEIMDWNQVDEENNVEHLNTHFNFRKETCHELGTEIEIPAVDVESKIECELEELSCISNVKDEGKLPLSNSDSSERSFQNIVEEAMRQSNISFTDKTENNNANVVVLDVPVTHTENLFGSNIDTSINLKQSVQSTSLSDNKNHCNNIGAHLKVSNKVKEKSKQETKLNNSNTKAISQLRPKTCKKSLILPNTVGFNPLLIKTGTHQTQTLPTILTTNMRTSSLSSSTSSSTAFLSSRYKVGEKNNDADVLNFVGSDQLSVISSNSQQATIMLLADDCASFTTVPNQNYIVKEIEKDTESILAVPQI